MKGYQFLENNFFVLCRKRAINKISMLLLIYLKGLYCYFGKARFYYCDEQIMADLGVGKRALRSARNKLRQRGVIDFSLSYGRGRATEYFILKTVLAPNIKEFVFNRKGCKTHPFSYAQKGAKRTPNINTIKPLEYDVKKSIKYNKNKTTRLRWEKRPEHINKEIEKILGRKNP